MGSYMCDMAVGFGWIVACAGTRIPPWAASGDGADVTGRFWIRGSQGKDAASGSSSGEKAKEKEKEAGLWTVHE